MIFELYTAGTFYDHKGKEKLEKLGFKFESVKGWIKPFRRIPEDELKEPPKLEINTLEELMDFIKEHGQCVVEDWRILIYDDYLE